MTSWRDRIRSELDAVRSAGRWRETVAFDGRGPLGTVGKRDMISFASNDYLGLAGHETVRAAASAAAERWGAGSSASRLVTGTRSLHHELEESLAQWKGTRGALLFPTGYAANLGVLQVFGAAAAAIFSDKLNHASIIDGCRLSQARVRRFRHNDVEHLSSLLEETPGLKLVVTEAVFSMDGDVAPLQEIEHICARHDALLIIDEAHAVLNESSTEQGENVLRVGTLSKSLGSLGGWVAGAKPLIELLVNRARTFIYTTAPTPADTAAALTALSIYRSDEGDQLKARLRRYVELLRAGHPSPIVPLILGSEAAAIEASKALYERGLYVPAIRPPTVPPGTSRLRVALSAAHTPEMIDRLREALLQIPLATRSDELPDE